jgi:hypothetical protein
MPDIESGFIWATPGGDIDNAIVASEVVSSKTELIIRMPPKPVNAEMPFHSNVRSTMEPAIPRTLLARLDHEMG